MNLEDDQVQAIKGLIEDSVSHLCEQEVLSGELVWSYVAALAECKRLEYKGVFSYEDVAQDGLSSVLDDFRIL